MAATLISLVAIGVLAVEASSVLTQWLWATGDAVEAAALRSLLALLLALFFGPPMLAIMSCAVRLVFGRFE